MDITPNNRVACQEVFALLDIRPSKEGGEMLLGELFQGPHCEVLSAESGRAQGGVPGSGHTTGQKGEG